MSHIVLAPHNGLRRYILTIACPDTHGIVAAVSGFLSGHGGFILESAQYGDPTTERFFMRIVFAANAQVPELAELEQLFAPIASRFLMSWKLVDAARKPRVVILVSRFGHCLNDLLHRWQTGQLAIDIPAVISNHEEMRSLVEWHGIPFHCLPVVGDKLAQERIWLDLVDELDTELVVLARYMQILSPAACERLAHRCINIHHSFLPGFKGAKPYHQAHARGVKIIGATAHYVTTDLDEGPIIEQAVDRVDHTFSPDDLVLIGRDLETAVLARAVKWHIEGRILPNENKTVVFR